MKIYNTIDEINKEVLRIRNTIGIENARVKFVYWYEPKLLVEI